MEIIAICREAPELSFWWLAAEVVLAGETIDKRTIARQPHDRRAIPQAYRSCSQVR